MRIAAIVAMTAALCLPLGAQSRPDFSGDWEIPSGVKPGSDRFGYFPLTLCPLIGNSSSQLRGFQ